jgi:hypothetical protein
VRDPLCLVAIAAYALNRWAIKPHTSSPFLHGHFNDLLLIPAALPWVLWLQRRTGLRLHDTAPTAAEIALHTAVWSLVCEYLGPRWLHRGTADPLDVAAYAAGGLVAYLLWHRAWGPAFVFRRRARPDVSAP